jgi:hypothetical protein
MHDLEHLRMVTEPFDHYLEKSIISNASLSDNFSGKNFDFTKCKDAPFLAFFLGGGMFKAKSIRNSPKLQISFIT